MLETIETTVLSTPVAVLIYKRPDLVRRVYEKLEKAKPKRVFVIADGPASIDEVRACDDARGVFSNPSWKTDIVLIASETNLGLRQRVISGLDEVFRHVETVIVLEEDCHPHEDFFSYCQVLLKKFKDQKRIALVSGNFYGLPLMRKNRVILSRHALIWGWATWRSTWEDFRSSEIGDTFRISTKDIKSIRRKLFLNPYRFQLIRTLRHGGKTSWAAYFASWVILNKRYALLPSRNVVSNVGFGSGATHTKFEPPDVNLPARSLKFPLALERPIGPGVYDIMELLGRTFRWSKWVFTHPLRFSRLVLVFLYRRQSEGRT